jgi:hypothetical protein
MAQADRAPALGRTRAGDYGEVGRRAAGHAAVVLVAFRFADAREADADETSI